MRGGLVLLGGALVALTAPFAALADAPFAPGGWDAVPPHAAALHDALPFAFDFANPESVLRIWEAPLAVGFCLVAVAGITMANRVRSAERFVGLVTLVAAGCVAALALGTGLEALLGPQGPGSFAYFFATPLAPLVACAAGLLALRRGGLCRFAARALAATPVLTILSAVILLQFPAGTGLGITTAWVVAVLRFQHDGNTSSVVRADD